MALDRFKLWSHGKFWAQSLVKRGRINDAIVYAEHVRDFCKDRYDDHSIDGFCEKALLAAGRADEAYEKFGLRVVGSGTYVSLYRRLVAKYPHRDKRKILLDLIEASGEKGKWFAAAKNLGFFDIALDCARAGQAKPATLVRATRDFADKEPEFAVEVGIESIKSLFSGASYEFPAVADVEAHYEVVMGVAAKHGLTARVKAKLSQVALRYGSPPNQFLREALVRKLQDDQ